MSMSLDSFFRCCFTDKFLPAVAEMARLPLTKQVSHMVLFFLSLAFVDLRIVLVEGRSEIHSLLMTFSLPSHVFLPKQVM